MLTKSTQKLILLVVVIFLSARCSGQTNTQVELRWIDSNSATQPVGVSWGVPWARGTVRKEQTFTLTNAEGKTIPVQTWTTAYWPDGSVKWTGFATVSTSKENLKLTANKTKTSSLARTLLATENAEMVTVNTGELRCTIRKTGNFLIDSLVVDGRLVG